MQHFPIFALASALLALTAEFRAEEFLVVFERLERRGSLEDVEKAEPILCARHEFVMARGGSIELKDAKGADGMTTTISATLTTRAEIREEHLLKLSYRFANSERSAAVRTEVVLDCGKGLTISEFRSSTNDMCIINVVRVHIKRATLN